MSNKKIAWEKWDEDILEQEIAEDFHESYQEDDEEAAEDALLFLDKIPHLVATPMGMFQLHDKMSVLNQFECWVGHTNFDITHSIKDRIESVEGVELLHITSRYRFFLGVGRLFNFSDVRQSIEKEICEKVFLDESARETVNLIKNEISQDKFWSIFVDIAGEIFYTSTNDPNDEEYLQTIETYELRKVSNGGMLLQNE